MGDVARLREHVAEAVVAIIDLSAALGRRGRQVVLDAVQAIKVIVGEGLRITAFVGGGNE
jgi:hypothetical protein